MDEIKHDDLGHADCEICDEARQRLVCDKCAQRKAGLRAAVVDAAMALAPYPALRLLAFMGTCSDVHGEERELIAAFLTACRAYEEVERG